MTLGQKIDEHDRWLVDAFTELHSKLNLLRDRDFRQWLAGESMAEAERLEFARIMLEGTAFEVRPK